MKTQQRAPQPTSLADIKSQILTAIPNRQLADYLNYQQLHIQDPKCLERVILCFKQYKFRGVSNSFKEAFESLRRSQRIDYYSNNLRIINQILEKKRRQPQSTVQLQDTSNCEQISINLKTEEGWRKQKIKINWSNKLIESLDYKIDLHHYILLRRKEYYVHYAVLKPIIYKLPTYQFNSNQYEFQQLFQRLQRLVDASIEDNMIKIIEGQSPDAPLQQHQNHSQTERHLFSQKKSTIHKNSTGAILNTQAVLETTDYLKYSHPIRPLQRSIQRKLLIPTTDIHYLLQGQYKISDSGQLVVINEQKLAQQSNVIKYIIKRLLSGTKVFSISLPVQVFSSQSNLSLLLSSFRFAPTYLQNPSSNSLQRFKQVIKFSMSCPPCYIRCDKPFNPILGETYQRIVDGTIFCGQQVSHHPPISAAFIKGRGYTLYGSFQAEVEFGINSATGNNKGWVKISFDEGDISKQVVKFTNIPGEMGGLIFGKRTLNLINSVYFIDQQNFLFCKLFFGKIKYQPKEKVFKDSVEGKVVKLKPTTDLSNPDNITQSDISEYYGLISGQWLSNVYFNDELLINTRKEYPPEVELYQGLLKSDYSFRQDIILKINGSTEECQYAKQKLEQYQRKDRKLRQKYNK